MSGTNATPGRQGGRRKASGTGLALAAGIVAGAFAVCGAWTVRRLAQRRDLHVCMTASGPAIVCTIPDEDGMPVRVLRQGGVYQSATYLDENRFRPPFAYYRAFERLFDVAIAPAELGGMQWTGRLPQRILLLGGGGYAWPKWTLSRHANVRLDVVEIDPAVTDIARRWFFLDELMDAVGFDAWRLDPAGVPHFEACSPSPARRLGLFQGDGRAYLEACAQKTGDPLARYDAIVNDTFVGKRPVRALSTAEAARTAKRVLAPGGLYLANVVSNAGGTDLAFLRRMVGALGESFAHVHVVPCSDEDFGGEDNYLVIATDGAYTTEFGEAAFQDAIPYDDDFPLPPLRDAE